MYADPRPAAPTDSPTRPRQTVLWIIAILLAVIATTLIVRPAGGPALPLAYADAPSSGGARGIFALTGPLDNQRQGLWMVDVESRVVWCYEYLPSTRKMKLVAARSFDYDRYLEDYGNDEPTVAQVKQMLDQRRKVRDRLQRTDADEDDDGLGISLPGEIEPGRPSKRPDGDGGRNR